MTEPVDPNEPASNPYPQYEPPPPFSPPAVGGYPPPPGPYGPPGGYGPPAGGYGPPPAGGYGPPPGGYGPPPAGGYGPPPAGGYGWPGGDWTPEPAPSHGTRNLVIALVVVLVLAGAGVGAYFLLRGDGSGDASRPKVPAAFGGYELLDNAAATQLKSSLRQMGNTLAGGAASKVFDAGSLGVYAHDSGDQPVLITLTVPTSSAGGGTSDDITTHMLRGATTSSDSFPAGPRGGSVRCGQAQFGAVSETMCAWSDGTDSGLLVSIRESLSPTDLATVTQALRDAVE